MDCNEARLHLLDRRRGTLEGALAAELDAHFAGCPACRHEEAADEALSRALQQRLPRRPAPTSLRRALRARWAYSTLRTRPWSAVRTVAALALGAALSAVVVLAWRSRSPDQLMVAEAVNDHLRVLYSQHPLEVESGGIHQVKPWFSGRLDFAPVTAFAGDDEFPLQGGSVGYFVDRKAATLVFKRHLHVITLFVFSAPGLRWPSLGLTPVGAAHGSLETSRGFHVVLWRQGDLGYALVSDVNETELLALGAKIAGPSM